MPDTIWVTSSSSPDCQRICRVAGGEGFIRLGRERGSSALQVPLVIFRTKTTFANMHRMEPARLAWHPELNEPPVRPMRAFAWFAVTIRMVDTCAGAAGAA